MIKELIDLLGWRDIIKGMLEGLIVTTYLAAMYFAMVGTVPLG